MYYLVFSNRPLLQLKFEIRSFASLYPKLFYPLMLVSGRYPGRSVQRNTELVIEGFPRSANSFSMGAFLSVQTRPIVLASHLHAAAQIIRASRLSIPTILLIRQPVDAVISLLSLELQTHNISYSERDLLELSLKKYLINWIAFYQQVKPYYNDYIIGLFDEVTKDFGAVIKKVNQRFKTDFNLFLHTEESVKLIHEQVGFHAGPSQKRQYLKPILIKHLDSDEMKLLIYKAEGIYREFEMLAKANSIEKTKLKLRTER